MAKKKGARQEVIPFTNAVVELPANRKTKGTKASSWFTSWLFPKAAEQVKNDAYTALKYAVNNPRTMRIKRDAETARALNVHQLAASVPSSTRKRAQNNRDARLMSQFEYLNIVQARPIMSSRGSYRLGIMVATKNDALLLDQFNGRCIQNVCFTSGRGYTFYLTAMEAETVRAAVKAIQKNFNDQRKAIRTHDHVLITPENWNKKLTDLNSRQKQALHELAMETASQAHVPDGIITAIWGSFSAMIPKPTHPDIFVNNERLVNFSLIDHLVFRYYTNLRVPETSIAGFSQNLGFVHSVCKDLRAFFSHPSTVQYLTSWARESSVAQQAGTGSRVASRPSVYKSTSGRARSGPLPPNRPRAASA